MKVATPGVLPLTASHLVALRRRLLARPARRVGTLRKPFDLNQLLSYVDATC